MAALGTYQTTLFAQGEPAVVADAAVQRIRLDENSWVDLARNWLEGADQLLERLASSLSWRGGSRPMYGRLVEEPRLHAHLDVDEPATATLVAEMRGWLEDRYGGEINQNFVNYYRNGNDSVAWHADRIGLHQIDPIVVIVSLGGPRRFGLRPKPGTGAANAGREPLRLTVGSGDLLVMGGSCQHTWEHCVPKMALAAPRMSLTLRHVDDGPGDQWWYHDETDPPS